MGLGIEYFLPEKWIEFLKKQEENDADYKTVDIYFNDGLILMHVDIIDGHKFYFKNDRLDIAGIEKIILRKNEKEKC